MFLGQTIILGDDDAGISAPFFLQEGKQMPEQGTACFSDPDHRLGTGAHFRQCLGCHIGVGLHAAALSGGHDDGGIHI